MTAPFGKFRLRRGTAAQWTAANPILADGELALETDTKQIKIGDGVTAWTTLAYGGIQGPAGNAGPSGNAMTSVTLDFGSVPVYSKAFTLEVPGLLTTANVAVVHDPDSDEAEMDGFSSAAFCSADGILTAFIQAIPGPVVGTRKFNYFVG